MIKMIIQIKIYLIKIYKYIFSPLLGNNCRYVQNCSDYYIGSLKEHGLLNGTCLGIKRILTCHPLKFLGGGSSYDYVPKKNKFRKQKLNG